MTLRFLRTANSRMLRVFAAALALLFLLINTGNVAAIWVIINAEQSTLSGQAAVISDSLAANGQAVSFGQAGIVLPSPGSWTNSTNNLANLPSECGNLTLLSQVPGRDKIIAGVARRGLYASTNGGASWSALGTGSGSAAINNRPNHIVYDPLNPDIFWVAGIYGPGIYKTTDGGSTFQRLGNIEHNDGISVDFTDPSRQTLLAGGHEQSRTVYKSTNGGQTWTNIGGGISGTNFTTFPLIIDSQTYIVNSAASWAGGSTGIFRTTNGGVSWQQVSSEGPAKAPLRASNGNIYWSTGDGVVRSTDNGVTWSRVGGGLRGEVDPVELPDGRLVSVGGNALMISGNNGSSWTPFGANLPFSFPAGVIYSPSRNIFFSWTWDCGNSVLPNAIMKLQ